MDIMFDSNVWRIVATPSVFTNEPAIDDFLLINDAVRMESLVAYISETVFTIEAINKKQRKSIIGGTKQNIKAEERKINGYLGVRFSIGPGEPLNLDSNPILKNHLNDAIQLGFRIVRLPRIGGLINDSIEPYRMKFTGRKLDEYHKRVFEIAREIESNNAGVAHIKEIGYRYNKHWIKGIQDAPAEFSKEIAKAAAE